MNFQLWSFSQNWEAWKPWVSCASSTDLPLLQTYPAEWTLLFSNKISITFSTLYLDWTLWRYTIWRLFSLLFGIENCRNEAYFNHVQTSLKSLLNVEDVPVEHVCWATHSNAIYKNSSYCVQSFKNQENLSFG